MFIVFNKERIGTYLILLSTVFILFGAAISMREDKCIETSQNIDLTIINNISDYYNEKDSNVIFEE